MKFCPYCGASLVGGAASFCGECGMQIPPKGSDTDPKIPQKPRPCHKQKNGPVPAAKRKQPPKPIPKAPSKRKVNPMDINYDGYYKDVQPIDAGQQGKRMDPDMTKKIALLLAGAVLVIILAAVLMTAL